MNTTFINFCKSIISKYDPNSCKEVYAAEAMTRFISGSYYALQISIILMIVNSYILFKTSTINESLITIFVIFGYLILLHIILSQYRFLRCKEIDTIFNACFANRKNFEKLFPKPSDRKTILSASSNDYDQRKNLLVNLWKAKIKNKELVQSIKLDKLIDEMKKRSNNNPALSSLYFAGSYIDHPFFLENNKIAIGISVLPEDKAGLRKRHPNQIEYLVILKGTINVHLKQNNKTKNIILNENESFEIQKNQCHWIKIDKSCKSAAYLFLKTNPSKEPKEKEC